MRTWMLCLRWLAFPRCPGKISLANISVVCARPCQTARLELRNGHRNPSFHTPHAMHLRNASAGQVCRPPGGAILGVTRSSAGNGLSLPPLTFCLAAATWLPTHPLWHTAFTAFIPLEACQARENRDASAPLLATGSSHTRGSGRYPSAGHGPSPISSL
ncbi:uncharacterized protein B0T15DRAFT_208094 [Chaetomium strumarium]|uniref:Secreted protein n=1 Tax=Chaetomium strumarium TaxID=1170767 RepID=A0AAJ0GTN4_9PEZI|nr:hypothetical protein B0T15DRAFT_208094 [Chaetomium strumarium]